MALLQKSIDKRDAVLKATLDLVNNGGIQSASMAKVAKLANVSPATIYLFFEHKQDLLNQLYLAIKEAFATAALSAYQPDEEVKLSFEKIWKAMMLYKLEHKEEASFLSQCDNSPMIDEETREKGLVFLEPLSSLWERGKQEGSIKNISNYLLYAFSIYPLAFLVTMEAKGSCPLDVTVTEAAFQSAWDSIAGPK
jgi:AcrR family transcriptional regulator